MKIKLNAAAARDVGESARITETGKYKGTFKRAELTESDRGTIGVEFTFMSNDGQSADYLTLWIENGDGKELYGYKVLNAVMTCMQVRGIESKLAKIEKRINGELTQVDAEIFPDLMGKQIGLLLVKAPYEAQDGSVKSKMEIFATFCAQTERTAKEILDRVADAKALPKIIASLADRPVRRDAQKRGGGSTNSHGGGSGFADVDDDIPF